MKNKSLIDKYAPKINIKRALMLAIVSIGVLFVIVRFFINPYFWDYDFYVDMFYTFIFLVSLFVSLKIKNKIARTYFIMGSSLLIASNFIEALITAFQKLGRHPIFQGYVGIGFQIVIFIALFLFVQGMREFYSHDS